MELIDLGLGLAMAVLFLFCALLSWNDARYKRKGLPPGTMGWPFFGETREFVKGGPLFMSDRKARYGEMYKTHVLGWPTVISTNPDINRYILMNEKEGLVPGYPKAMRDILGTSNISAVHGDPHKTMRGAMLHLINPTSLRERIMHKTDKFVRTYIRDWGGKTLEIQTKTKDMAILTALDHITDIDSGPISEDTKGELYKIYFGTISLPIDLPFSRYRRGLEGRRRIISIMRKLMEEREASSHTCDDMLLALQNFKDFSGKSLTQDQVIDSIITLLNSGFESFSTISMMALVYLKENPKALEELRNEHMEIRKNKSPDDDLDWNDYMSMVFTRQVIYETLRLSSLVSGMMRLTTRDVNLNGYVIPKGWKVYVYTRETNYDPSLYPEPHTFNPWRWKDKSLGSHPHFMIFGGGGRYCPGKELEMVEVSMFLHHIVTKFSWEFVGGEKLLAFPKIYAPKGLHVKVSKLEEAVGNGRGT